MASSYRLVPDIELLGQFDGDAFTERPYIIKRHDGQVLQVSALLYAVISAMHTEPDASLVAIAATATQSVGQEVSDDNVAYLIENKISPLGLIDNGTPVSHHTPLLALRFRTKIIPERVHRGVTTALKPLFSPVVVLAVMSALIVGDLWFMLFAGTDFRGVTNQMVTHPVYFILITALGVFMGMFHELGHATATRYGGARPGVMGAGIYLVWPVFYTDVTDSYRLDRRGRLRIDLGGVYFNVIIIVACLALYSVTGFAPFLAFALLSHIDVAYQFMPFIRLDGYWMLSDFVGVPNLFAYMKPIMARLVGRNSAEGSARLQEIKKRSRTVITTWVLLTFVVITANVAFILIIGPYFVTRSIDQLSTYWNGTTAAFASGAYLSAISGTISGVLLAIPIAGIAVMVYLLVKQVVVLMMRAWPTKPVASIALAGALALILVVETSRILPNPSSPSPSTQLAGPVAAPTAGAPATSILDSTLRDTSATNQSVTKNVPTINNNALPTVTAATPAPEIPKSYDTESTPTTSAPNAKPPSTTLTVAPKPTTATANPVPLTVVTKSTPTTQPQSTTSTTTKKPTSTTSTTAKAVTPSSSGSNPQPSGNLLNSVGNTVDQLLNAL